MKKLFLLMVAILLFSCSKEPKKINYGKDNCDFCTMSIVEKPYGSELVTDKGKVFKFDSFECMLSYMSEMDDTEYAHILTSTMDNPENFTDAKTCTFLISNKLPSPMGANITAFSSENLAKEAQVEFGGNIFDYSQVIKTKKNINKH